MGKVSSFYIIIFLILCGCFGCSRQPDERLCHVASIISRTPKEALASLDSINRKNLGRTDQHFYDFLTIKGRDKAYIKHTGDSLYLSVLDYYSKHRVDTLYPEVLYYGGRVYSDLGDYPTALQYFQKSLDLLPEDTKQLELRTRALTQTGVLLTELRLYDKAIPYLEKAIKIDSLINDSLGLMFDKQLLGSINLKLKDYNTAENKFKQARSIATRISPVDIAQLDVYLAAVKSRTNKHDSAIKLISSIVKKNILEDRDNALANAAEIYYRAQIYDTAYMYAHDIIRNKSKNLKFALHLVMTPNLVKYIPNDSLYSYISEYQEATNRAFDQNKDNEALLQSAYYNYQLHDREREKTYKEKTTLKNILIWSIFLILLLIVSAVYLLMRNKQIKIQLHDALDKLNILRKVVNVEDADIQNQPDTNSYNKNISIAEFLASSYNDRQNLMQHTRHEFLYLQQNQEVSRELDAIIITSDVYTKLQNYLEKNKVITEDDSLWEDLEKIICKSAHDFKRNLFLLTGGDLKTDDLHVALLIKCNVSPTKISNIIGRHRSTISYRKEKMSKRLLGQKFSSNVLEDIIHLL